MRIFHTPCYKELLFRIEWIQWILIIRAVHVKPSGFPLPKSKNTNPLIYIYWLLRNRSIFIFFPLWIVRFYVFRLVVCAMAFLCGPKWNTRACFGSFEGVSRAQRQRIERQAYNIGKLDCAKELLYWKCWKWKWSMEIGTLSMKCTNKTARNHNESCRMSLDVCMKNRFGISSLAHRYEQTNERIYTSNLLN